MGIHARVQQYIDTWRGRGYTDDIPDVVPEVLSELGLAPSYKSIALAILSNDMHLTSLGFSAPKSDWYGVLKRIELTEKGKIRPEESLFDYEEHNE